MLLTKLCINKLPVGYFKRIINLENSPSLRLSKWVDGGVGSKSGPGRAKRCVKSLGFEDRFTILKVDSKLVDPKNLNKYLRKVMATDHSRHQISYLLRYIVNSMSQALDDPNLLTIIVMMSKLEIRDRLLLDSIVLLLYKMEDFNKITDCLLYSSMMFGSSEALKAFAMKVVYDLPKYSNYATYNNIAKLCESLCHLNLYSEDFGNLIASLVYKDTLSSNELNMLNFSSILNYLSNTGVGDENSWRLYTKYSLDNIMSSNHKVVLKLLESFVNRNLYNKALFRNCGHSLSKLVDYMHPNDIASASYYYFKVNFRHDELFGEIFRVGERISTNLNSKASLKLLSGYHMYFASLEAGPLLESSQPIAGLPDKHNHLYRTVYLIYNNISASLNSLDFEDFLLLFKTLETFSFINTRNLKINLNTFLSTCVTNIPVNSKVDLIKSRYSEKRSIDLSQHAFIKSLMY